MSINWRFITEQESYSLKGYWPEDQLASGVTVCGGVDLGQLSEKEIGALPLSLQEKLRPYIGLKGRTAQLALNGCPLILTQMEADVLELPKRDEMESLLCRHFQHDTESPFEILPSAVQTVLMSLTWQYGNPWSDTKCGDVWHLVGHKKYHELVDYLTIPDKDDGRAHFPDHRFRSRRKREADYLRENLVDEVVVAERASA